VWLVHRNRAFPNQLITYQILPGIAMSRILRVRQCLEENVRAWRPDAVHDNEARGLGGIDTKRPVIEVAFEDEG
jgi:hypothetical protein